MTIKCAICGKFASPMQVGSSWSENWRYCIDGSAELLDPSFQCKICTEKEKSSLVTNCVDSSVYEGIFAEENEPKGYVSSNVYDGIRIMTKEKAKIHLANLKKQL